MSTAYESLLEDLIRNPRLIARFELPPVDDPSVEALHAAFTWAQERLRQEQSNAELLALFWRFAKATENVALALLIADHTESGEDIWNEMLESDWLNYLEEPVHVWQEWILDLARRQANGEEE